MSAEANDQNSKQTPPPVIGSSCLRKSDLECRVERRSSTGGYLPIPIGHKTPQMLAVERQLKRTIEEDYFEFYILKALSQRQLAKRWGVSRNRIFFQGGRSPCWVQRLNLPLKSTNVESPAYVRKNLIEVQSNCGAKSGGIATMGTNGQETRSQIIAAAEEAVNEAGREDVTEKWWTKCVSLGQNRRIQHEVPVSTKLRERIDLVDWEERCAYELNVSGHNAADEFHKDLFKVILFNEAHPDEQLTKFVFITTKAQGNRKGLETRMSKALVGLTARKLSLEVHIKNIHVGCVK